MIEYFINKDKNMTFRRVLLMIFVGLMSVMSSRIMAFPEGEDVPNLFGRSLDGRVFRLSDYVGKVRVVQFFRLKKNCRQCLKSLQEFLVLEKRFKDIMFVAVYVGDKSREEVLKYTRTLKQRPQHLVMVNDAKTVKKLYRLTRFPAYLAIDGKNQSRLFFNGRDPDYLQNFLQSSGI